MQRHTYQQVLHAPLLYMGDRRQCWDVVEEFGVLQWHMALRVPPNQERTDPRYPLYNYRLLPVKHEQGYGIDANSSHWRKITFDFDTFRVWLATYYAVQGGTPTESKAYYWIQELLRSEYTQQEIERDLRTMMRHPYRDDPDEIDSYADALLILQEFQSTQQEKE
jgi:hypothetical protein